MILVFSIMFSLALKITDVIFKGTQKALPLIVIVIISLNIHVGRWGSVVEVQLVFASLFKLV